MAPRTASMVALALSLMLLSARQVHAGDTEDVRAVVAREIDAWSKFDTKAVVSLYTSDAIWQNPFGVRLHGTAELAKFLNQLFARPGYRAAKDTSPAKVVDLRFPAPGVAVVWSDEASTGQIDDLTGKPMAPRHSYYLEVLVKKDGAWKISECLIMDEIPRSK